MQDTHICSSVIWHFNMKTPVKQGRSGGKALGARKMKKRLGFKLQIVDSPVEEIVAMLSAKTKLLGKLVVRLLKDNRKISPLVIELLSIVGGDASAEALSMVHARTESPVVSYDPKAPNLSYWQMKVQAHVDESEDMAKALVVGLESLWSWCSRPLVSTYLH